MVTALVERVAQAIHARRCQAYSFPCSGPEAADYDDARAALVPVRQAALELADKWEAQPSPWRSYPEASAYEDGKENQREACADELRSLFPEEGETPK